MGFMAVFMCVLGLLVNSPVHAEVYKWTDAQGRVHYADKPVSANAGSVVIPEINRMQAQDYTSRAAHIPVVPKSKKVVMYATQWCGYCKKARRYFQKKNIAYTEYDVEKNAQAYKAYLALKPSGYPLIFVDGQRMNGFSETGFERLYKR